MGHVGKWYRYKPFGSSWCADYKPIRAWVELSFGLVGVWALGFKFRYLGLVIWTIELWTIVIKIKLTIRHVNKTHTRPKLTYLE